MFRRKRVKRTRLIAVLLMLILLISIGYAALSTRLSITGNATVKLPALKVYFTNLQIAEGSVVAITEPTTSGTTTTTINWEVTMDTPGQYYEFTVDVKNDGRIDAMIGSLTNQILTEEQAKYLNYAVTYSGGAQIEQYDELKIGTTETIKVRIEFKEDINPEDLPESGGTISLTYTLNYVQADSNAKERNRIGDTVNYITTLNGQTLSNWRVFYVEGDYTYIILDDYLPNVALNTSSLNLSTNGTYSVYASDNRDTLLNAMKTKTYWTSLLEGTMNGTAIDYSTTEDTNIYAMGSPTLELYVKSWNRNYPANKLYTAITGTGYYVGTSNPPTLTYEDMSSTPGYKNTLYYPHTSSYDECVAYWLASPSADWDGDVMDVYYNGYVSGNTYNRTELGIRPVVCLPSDVLKY